MNLAGAHLWAPQPPSDRNRPWTPEMPGPGGGGDQRFGGSVQTDGGAPGHESYSRGPPPADTLNAPG